MTSSPRILTRSSDDKMVSGVSGGIGAYLGVDPVLVRVGFVVATLATGIGLLAYLALWALVPSGDAQAAAAVPA
jgi:phage shock protein PspC (stress-responsive transcriptional regulator)